MASASGGNMTIRIISSEFDDVESAVTKDELGTAKSKPTRSTASKGVLRMLRTPSQVGKTLLKEPMEFFIESIFVLEQEVSHRLFLGEIHQKSRHFQVDQD